MLINPINARSVSFSGGKKHKNAVRVPSKKHSTNNKSKAPIILGCLAAAGVGAAIVISKRKPELTLRQFLEKDGIFGNCTNVTYKKGKPFSGKIIIPSKDGSKDGLATVMEYKTEF